MARYVNPVNSKLPFLVKRAKNLVPKHKSGEPLYYWERVYEDAVTQKDTDRMFEKISRAEQAIFQRAQELLNDSDEHKEERDAMADAATLLCEMKVTLLRHAKGGNAKNA